MANWLNKKQMGYLLFTDGRLSKNRPDPIGLPTVTLNLPSPFTASGGLP